MTENVLNICMEMIHPLQRKNWELVEQYFTTVFKMKITKAQWEKWQNENIVL